MTRLDRIGSRIGLVCIAALSLSACSTRSPKPRKSAETSATAPAAPARPRAETVKWPALSPGLWIPLGTSDGDAYLVDGWGKPASTPLGFPARYTVGKSSRILARIKEAPNRVLIIDGSGYAELEATVKFNGRPAETLKFSQQPKEFVVPVPPGENVDVTLAYDKVVVPGGGDTMERALVVRRLYLGPIPTTLQLVGEAAKLHFKDGFEDPVALPPAPPAPGKPAPPPAVVFWSSGKKSTLSVKFTSIEPYTGGIAFMPGKTYELGVQARSLDGLGLVDVGVRVNGKRIGQLHIDKPGYVTLPVMADLLKIGDNEIEFSYSKTGSPPDKAAGKTERTLAVRYALINLGPKRPSSSDSE